MRKSILVVDDDPDMVTFLKEGLGAFEQNFAVKPASDGKEAVALMAKNAFHMVVTDLKMPRMDGIALLGHIVNHYPDIPVIVMTAYSTPMVKKASMKRGAHGYIQKPFLINELVKKIRTLFQYEADGGVLHHFAAATFLQLVELEQRTCTLRISDSRTQQKGVLFIREGQLLEARLDKISGEEAALEIISWDKVSLTIQNRCTLKKPRIKTELTKLLVDAMRKHDRQEPSPPTKIPPPKSPSPAPPSSTSSTPAPSTAAPRAPTPSDEQPQEQDPMKSAGPGALLAEVLDWHMQRATVITEFAIFNENDDMVEDAFESVAIEYLVPSVIFLSAEGFERFHGDRFSNHCLLETKTGEQYLLFELNRFYVIAGLKMGIPVSKVMDWMQSVRSLSGLGKETPDAALA